MRVTTSRDTCAENFKISTYFSKTAENWVLLFPHYNTLTKMYPYRKPQSAPLSPVVSILPTKWGD